MAVLTDGLWHQLFGGSADALGKTMILNSMPHTIVGVLPRGFEMPMVAGAEVWMTGDRGIPRSFPFPGDITAVRDSHIIARDRPARAGRDARTGAGAAHERDGVAVAALSVDATPASAPASCRCTRRSSATCGR